MENIKIGNGIKILNGSEIKIGTFTLYSDKHFNWFQKKMLNWFFGFEVHDYSDWED